MTTPVWITGFEYGLATISTSGGGLAYAIAGTPSVQSTIKRSGNYAMRSYTSVAGTAYIDKAISGSPTYMVARFYIYFAAWPSVNGRVYVCQNASATNSPHVYINATTHKVSFVIGSSSQEYGTALELDTWYRIDLIAYVGGTTFTLDGQVNGNTVTQTTLAGQTATSITYARVGLSTSATADIYYDDVIVSVTSGDYPIGAGAVIGLRPDSDGTHNNASNIMEDADGNDIDGSTYYAYDKLDEDPWTSTANSDYVRQTGNGTGNYCEIQFADTTETSIQGVMALLEYASATATSNTGGCIIRSNTTETTLWGVAGALADYSESSAFYKSVIVSPDGGSWTQAVANALRCRFGYSDDANPDPYWLAIMLEVAYVPAIGITLTVADIAHANALDATGVLVQTHNIILADIAHANALEAVALVQQHILGGVADIAHANALEAVALSLATTLALADMAHAHSLDAVVLSQLHNLVMADIAHAHALDAIVLSQLHNLVLADIAHAHSLDAINLSGEILLALADIAHAHALESVALSQAHVLTLADIAHGHALDMVVLAQLHNLIIADIAHAHALETVNLSQLHNLVVTDIAHAHALEALVLSVISAGTLNIQDMLHGHALEAVALSQVHNLVIADVAHANTLDAVILSRIYNLVLADIAHAHALDGITLASGIQLILADIAHAHSLDSLALTQAHLLSPADIAHAHALDALTISLGVPIELVLADIAHAHALDGLTLADLIVLAARIYAIAAEDRAWAIGHDDRAWAIEQDDRRYGVPKP